MLKLTGIKDDYKVGNGDEENRQQSMNRFIKESVRNISQFVESIQVCRGKDGNREKPKPKPKQKKKKKKKKSIQQSINLEVSRVTAHFIYLRQNT